VFTIEAAGVREFPKREFRVVPGNRTAHRPVN
jgi:hypothetical protein